MKPRKPIKRKSAHQRLVEDADAWAKAIVLNRQGPLCLRCKLTKPLQGAHVMRKGGKYNSLRHNLDNIVGMCAGCHIGWAHHNELEFYEWIEEIFPGRIERLRGLARVSSAKIDLKMLICVLRDIARKEGVTG